MRWLTVIYIPVQRCVYPDDPLPASSLLIQEQHPINTNTLTTAWGTCIHICYLWEVSATQTESTNGGFYVWKWIVIQFFFFEKKNSLNISNYILKYSCKFEVCRNPRAFMVGTHLHMTCVSFHSLIHKASLAQACFLKQIPSVFRQLRSPAPLFVSPQLVSPCIVPSGLCLVNCSEQRETLNSLSHKIILHSFICRRSLKPRRQKRSLWGTRGRWQRNADKTEMGGMGEREGF